MAAGEIGEFDRVDRAFRLALAAAYAFIVIDDGEIIDEGDGSVLAVPYAETAAQAARGAFAADGGALFMARAHDDDLTDVREELDQVIRAGLGAEAAAYALSCIDVRDAVFDADGALRAGLGAIAEVAF